MEFLSQTYIALRGPTGAPQSPSETIVRLADRLSPATLLADRRAAVLALKGLSRDCKEEVGERALVGLVEVLQNDAEVDADIGKAVLETLNVLCEVDGELLTSQPQQHPHPHFKELGYKHTDLILSNEQVTHKLFSLLADPSFYLRLSILQFLITLLHNRRQVVQGYFLKSQDGPITVISVLEDKREIIRNEAITLIQSLVHQSPDIQKVLAFQGAFERLFNIINQEGGLEGGTVVTDVLTCIDLLLRFNSANQNYFRDTPLPPMLPALLLFPPGLPPNELAPQGFALQFWDSPHKAPNASLCVGIIGMLVGTKGGSQQESIAFSRCLVELALASNAPSLIKTQALRLLPANLVIPLPSLTVTPYMPVPDTNDEEWDRLEPSSALDALVELVLHGEYNGLFAEKRSKDGLELRAAALGVFQNFVQREEIRCTILRMMLPAEGSTTPPPPTPLLSSLIAVPSSPLNIATVTSTHLSCLLFAHLLRASPRAKALARSIYPPPPSADTQDTSSFFVPADGGPPPSTQPVSPPEPEDEPQSLLQTLNEHLSLAFLERKRADTSDREAREWDRLIVGYLTLLIQWLWEDPSAVKDFLEAGGLGMLVEPINEIADSEPVIPGLCSFLLGICYEYNLEPGEIKRTTIHPILTRLGVDLLVGRITHLRDDDRFKAVGPDSIVTIYPNQSTSIKDEEKEAEIWFDWAFVDFWKSSYYTIQKGLATDPNTVSTAAGQSVETAMLVSSLREVIQKQATEIEELQNKLKALPPPSAPPAADTVELQTKYDLMMKAFAAAKEKLDDSEKQIKEYEALKVKHEEVEQSVKDVEKEQEDLLVLLDELNGKRKRDKQRMREAGMDVSEDEEEEEEEDE